MAHPLLAFCMLTSGVPTPLVAKKKFCFILRVTLYGSRSSNLTGLAYGCSQGLSREGAQGRHHSWQGGLGPSCPSSSEGVALSGYLCILASKRGWYEGEQIPLCSSTWLVDRLVPHGLDWSQAV